MLYCIILRLGTRKITPAGVSKEMVPLFRFGDLTRVLNFFFFEMHKKQQRAKGTTKRKRERELLKEMYIEEELTGERATE